MTDEQIIRARVMMAELGINVDDLDDEQVEALAMSLGRVYCEEWPRGDFEPILPAPVLDEP